MLAFRFFAVLASAAAGSVALAGLKVQINTDHPDRKQDFSGGVFRAVDFSSGESLPEAEFGTFCLESGEYFYPGVVYDASIGTATMSAGAPDPLDARTAYLYYTYRTNPSALNSGLSSGASFTGTQSQRQNATKQLQQAIWKIENEGGGQNNGLVALANLSGWTGIGNVRVLNVFTLNPNGSITHRQDQLLLVPEPAAALLGVIGLGLSACLRRRLA